MSELMRFLAIDILCQNGHMSMKNRGWRLLYFVFVIVIVIVIVIFIYFISVRKRILKVLL